MNNCHMRKADRRPGKIIKYEKPKKREKSETLEAALRRILTLDSCSDHLKVADAGNLKGGENTLLLPRKIDFQSKTKYLIEVPLLNEKGRTSEDNKSERTVTLNQEQCYNSSVACLRDVSLLEHVKESEDNQPIRSKDLESDKSILTSSNESIVMDPTNDSIIWNNRSTEQLESSLSLVVNPPSTISQQDESVLSDDSQFARSGVDVGELDLEDERRWLKYRVENLTRDECIIICVLAQMILSDGELPGRRDMIPNDEEAKQSLLFLCYDGGCWELNNLRSILDLAECLPVGLRRLCGLGVRDRGQSARKMLEGRLEQCLDLSRRLGLQHTV